LSVSWLVLESPNIAVTVAFSTGSPARSVTTPHSAGVVIRGRPARAGETVSAKNATIKSIDRFHPSFTTLTDEPRFTF
jgi:hypothetical protein